MSSTASPESHRQLKARLERLSDALDDLEEVLVDDEPLDTLEDALQRVRSTIIEIEEML